MTQCEEALFTSIVVLTVPAGAFAVVTYVPYFGWIFFVFDVGVVGWFIYRQAFLPFHTESPERDEHVKLIGAMVFVVLFIFSLIRPELGMASVCSAAIAFVLGALSVRRARARLR